MMHTVTGENSLWGVLPRFFTGLSHRPGKDCLPVLLDRNAVRRVFCQTHGSPGKDSANK